MFYHIGLNKCPTILDWTNVLPYWTLFRIYWKMVCNRWPLFWTSLLTCMYVCLFLQVLTMLCVVCTQVTLAMSCRLNGPDTCSSLATFSAMSTIFPLVSALMSCAGNTSEASPLCTPAFSMCSLIAMTIMVPSLATASTSIS